MNRRILQLGAVFCFLISGPAYADQYPIFVSVEADEQERVKRVHAVEHVRRSYFSKRGGTMGRLSDSATESLRRAQKGDQFTLPLAQDLSLQITVLRRRDAMGVRYYTVSWPPNPQHRLAATPDNPITPERVRSFAMMHEALISVFDWDYNRATGEYVLAINRPPMSGQGEPTGEEPIIAYLETHDLNTLSTFHATLNFPIDNRRFELAPLQKEPAIHLITEVDQSRTGLMVRDEEETDAAREERRRFESALENARQTERRITTENRLGSQRLGGATASIYVSPNESASDDGTGAALRLDEYSELLDPEKTSFFEGNLEAVKRQLKEYSPVYYKTFIHPEGTEQSIPFKLIPSRAFSTELSQAVNNWDIETLETMSLSGDPEASRALHYLLDKCALAVEELGVTATRCSQVTDADIEAAAETVLHLAEDGYVPAILMSASQAEFTDPGRARNFYLTIWDRGFVDGIYRLADLTNFQEASSVDEQIEVFGVLYASLVLKVTHDDGLHPGTSIMERRNRNAAELQTLLSSYPIYVVEGGIEFAQDLIETNQACCLALNGGQ